jgi:hypothetical protein
MNNIYFLKGAIDTSQRKIGSNIERTPFILDLKQYLLLLLVLAGYLTYALSGSVLIITCIQLLLILRALFFNIRPESRVVNIIAALFMGAEVGLFMFSSLYVLSCFRRGVISILHKRSVVILVLAIYSFCIFLINSLSEFLPINYFLWLMIFFGPYTMYYFTLEIDMSLFELSRVKIFLFKLILLQILLLLFQGWSAGGGAPGDWAIGTLLDAHKLGFVFMFGVVYSFFRFLKKRLMRDFIAFFVMAISLYMCDAKAVLSSGILAGIILTILSVLNVKIARDILNKVLAVYILLILTLILITYPFFDTLSNVWGEFSDIYLYGTYSSSKYQMYAKVWGDMFYSNPFLWLFGVGPGELASKASNMLSADVLWKQEGGLASLLPTSSSSWTRHYMDGLFGYEVVSRIPHVSSVLVYPFAGFISIKAELGLIGLFLFCYMNVNLLGRGAKGADVCLNKTLVFFGITLLVSLLFDNYHEQIPIAGLYLLIVGINTKLRYRK